MTAAMHKNVEDLEQVEEVPHAAGGDNLVDLTDTANAEPETVVTVVDADQLAHTAAEVAAMVARHQQELAAVMAELTTLQRVLRSEVREVVSELDRIASGVTTSAASELGSEAVQAEPEGAVPRSRGLSRFRRQS
ncbi:hypothetical protein IMCC26207_106222 [Actinobacteria bacterium IMCC26207]|nr:hypothetical protein IMCC26207_106222 [Actinobacteria bacterium IMCC26207]